MRRRFTEEAIRDILKEAEQGTKTRDIKSKHNITNAQFYAWRRMYGFGKIIDPDKNLKVDKKLNVVFDDEKSMQFKIDSLEKENAKLKSYIISTITQSIK